MATHTVDIDVIDKSALPEDHSNIPVINQPNPCYGYSATAKEVNYLMHFAQYCIYESGTNNIINGNTYLNYFPEEGSGGGGGVTPEEVQNMIDSSMRTLAPVASSGDYDDLIDKPVIDSSTSTESTNAIQNKGITNFVNSSIETATATFRGTYTTIEALNAAAGDKNDYAFYNHTDTSGNTVFDRYKFVPTEQVDLPEGYTQLEYIESSGTQYIDTGVPPTSKTRSYIKLDPLSYRYATCFFGIMSGYSNRGYYDPYYLNSDNESGKFRISGVSAVVSLDFPGVNEFEYNYPYITLNGDSVNIGDPGEWYYGEGNAIYLFAGNSNGQVGSFATMRLYGFKLYDTDGATLIRDFVPCKNASNIAGLYDLINSTFYPNKGTGSFIAGPQANGYWEYEYTLNNSSYTADQWATINSGITSSDKTQIGTNANDISSLNTNKLDKTGTAAKATADSAGNNIITTYAKKTDLNDLVCTFRGVFNTQQAMDAVKADKNDTAILQTTDANGNTVYTMESYVTVEGSDLPTGYTQLLYIASDGDQCIDTGVNLSSTRGFYLKFMPISENNNESSFGLWGFDNRNYSVNYRMYYYDSKYYLQYAEGTPEINVIINAINEVEFKPRVLTVNGESLTIADQGEWYFSGVNTATLFAYKSNGSGYAGKSTMRLYECKLYDDDKTTLLRHFVPVRNPNNEIGLYDTVEGQFYSNQGTGSFTAGPAADGYWVSQYSFLASIQGSLDAINTIIKGVL